MIFDGIPFNRKWHVGHSDIRRKSLGVFVAFFERKLGAAVLYDARLSPFERADLSEQFALAQTLRNHGVLTSYAPASSFPDEPPIKLWGGVVADRNKNTVGGASGESDERAITAMLAEALERYIWLEKTDYYDSPIRATNAEMERRRISHIALRRFTGFSDEQRRAVPSLRLDPDASYEWIRGDSLVSGKKIYVPAQTVSGASRNDPSQEPRIRLRTTIGLATWPTREGARLAGALEVIERDAYMIWWLNQLVLPRVNLQHVRERSVTLSKLLDMCAKYQLKIHAIKLLTDAPTHAVCVVVEDMSGEQPLYVLGLKAHRSLSYAIEKAITEALRSRIASRRFLAKGPWDRSTPIENIGHRDRLHYWATAEHTTALAFALRGEEQDPVSEAWETDTDQQQLDRVTAWCTAAGYECVSVPLGVSKWNPTPWHIEMVIIPELQQTYLTENLRTLGGTRLKTVPEMFGYTARAKPFLGAPHPFS